MVAFRGACSEPIDVRLADDDVKDEPVDKKPAVPELAINSKSAAKMGSSRKICARTPVGTFQKHAPPLEGRDSVADRTSVDVTSSNDRRIEAM
jgi:hypothetical protein